MEEWVGRAGLTIVLIGAIVYGVYKWYLANNRDGENGNNENSDLSEGGGAMSAV